MGNIKIIMAFAYVLTMFLGSKSYILEQQLKTGQEYFIYNAEYPNPYQPLASGKWYATSDPGTKIKLNCEEIIIPKSDNCKKDRLFVSMTGNRNFEDAHNYCGNGTLILDSQSNSLAVGLFAWPDSIGGRFLCKLKAYYDNTPPTKPPPKTCACGWKNRNRIVGGTETGFYEYPSMAGLMDTDKKSNFCGGSIISQWFVLTAAHCLLYKTKNAVAVMVGSHNITAGFDNPYAAMYYINDWVIHPEYNNYNNDIAIIQTQTQIVFSPYVGPICLPFSFANKDFTGQTVTALGWGLLNFDERKSDVLMGVDLQVLGNVQCKEEFGESVTPVQMCTYADNKDSCQSDSGGPLVFMDTYSQRLNLVGIISTGRACAGSVPGVNTRMTKFLRWILQMTPDAEYCT